MGCTATTSSPRANAKHIAFVAGLIAIGAICYLAAAFDTFPGDEQALRKFQGFQSEALDDAAIVASSTAQFPVAIVSIAALVFISWLLGRRADAAVALLILVAEAANLGFKELVDRPRPPFSLLESAPGRPAFPSGHALHAVLLFGLLLALVTEHVRTPRLRWALQGSLAFMILAVGASRVYLGVHWPSDVLGGYLVGIFCLLTLLWARKMMITRGLQ